MSKQKGLAGVSKRGRRFIPLGTLSPEEKQAAYIEANAKAAIAKGIFGDYVLVILKRLRQLGLAEEMIPVPADVITAFDADVHPLEFAQSFFNKMRDGAGAGE